MIGISQSKKSKHKKKKSFNHLDFTTVYNIVVNFVLFRLEWLENLVSICKLEREILLFQLGKNFGHFDEFWPTLSAISLLNSLTQSLISLCLSLTLSSCRLSCRRRREGRDPHFVPPP